MSENLIPPVEDNFYGAKIHGVVRNGDEISHILLELKDGSTAKIDVANVEHEEMSVSMLVENIFERRMPAIDFRWREVYEVAKEYYKILRNVSIETEEKNKIKEKLDKLSAPFSNDPAIVAFLEMERISKFNEDFRFEKAIYECLYNRRNKKQTDYETCSLDLVYNDLMIKIGYMQDEVLGDDIDDEITEISDEGKEILIELGACIRSMWKRG